MVYLRLDRGYAAPFHSGAKMTLLVELGIWLCILLLCLHLTFQPAISQPSFGGPILTCLPPASRIIPGGLCLLRVQLQLDPDLAAPAGFQEHFCRLTERPASLTAVGASIYDHRGRGGQAEEQGCRQPPRPVVGCCALINCPGTPDLVVHFHLEYFFRCFSPSPPTFFFFKQELAFCILLKIRGSFTKNESFLTKLGESIHRGIS